MTCSEERLAAFLAGDLSPSQERQVDEHLLNCQDCWDAVREARAGQRAASALRQNAPAGLAERVRMAIALSPGTPAPAAAPHSRLSGQRVPLWAAAACLALFALGGGVVGTYLARGSQHVDAPQVDAVVAMMTPTTEPPAALRAGEHMTIAHQPVMVKAYMVHGKETIVATSPRPFAMPARWHGSPSASGTAWTATKGHYSVYGVNRSNGHLSVFLVAAMPLSALPSVAAHLHLT